MNDLASLVYNPTVAAEINTAFDSTFDNMLVARVITNSSNIATITNLANKTQLVAQGENQSAMGSLVPPAHEDGVRPSLITQYATVAINWARKPEAYLTAINDLLLGTYPGSFPNREANIGVRPLSRYSVAVWGQGDADIWAGWAVRA